MIATTIRSTSGSLHDWRQQLGCPSRRHATPTIRPLAAISYLIRRPPRLWPHVELRDVTLVALFDERLPSGRLATRLVGVGGQRTASGLEFGGPELCRFDKDLQLRPIPGGRGACFDPAQGHLLALALQLDRYLQRCARYPHYPRPAAPRCPALVSPTDRPDSVFVDFSRVHQRQLIVYPTTDQLRGQADGLSYDFHTSRFRACCVAPGLCARSSNDTH
jgi:hypothetical protein